MPIGAPNEVWLFIQKVFLVVRAHRHIPIQIPMKVKMIVSDFTVRRVVSVVVNAGIRP